MQFGKYYQQFNITAEFVPVISLFPFFKVLLIFSEEQVNVIVLFRKSSVTITITFFKNVLKLQHIP